MTTEAAIATVARDLASQVLDAAVGEPAAVRVLDAVQNIERRLSGVSTHPREAQAEEQAEETWMQYATEAGELYWYNHETGESRWAEAAGDGAGSAVQEALDLVQRLHAAVRDGDYERVAALVSAGIDVNASDQAGAAPVLYAQDARMIELLSHLGASLYVVAPAGAGCLLHALASAGADEALSRALELVSRDGTLDAEELALFDKDGRTPLHVAAVAGHVECVRVLAACLVRHTGQSSSLLVESRDAGGSTARDLAGSLAAQDVLARAEAEAEVVELRRQAERCRELEAEISAWADRCVRAEALAQRESAAKERLEAQLADARAEVQEARYEVAQLLQENGAECAAPLQYDEYQGGAWEEHETEDGTRYLYNPESGESRWLDDAGHDWAAGAAEYAAPQGYNNNDDEDDWPEQPETNWHMQSLEQPHESHGPSAAGADPAEPASAVSSANSEKAERVGRVWAAFFERAAKASLQRDGGAGLSDTAAGSGLLATAIDLIDVDGVQAALEAGASVDDDLSEGSGAETVLHRCCALPWNNDKAVQSRIVHIAEILLDSNADVDARDTRQATPLHLACAAGNAPLVKVVLQSGAFVDAQDEEGDTPLHNAASGGGTRGHLKSVQLLARYGADLALANAQGNTPADSARIDMAMTERPPRAQGQIVDLLQQLQRAAAGARNPFAPVDGIAEGARQEDKNSHSQLRDKKGKKGKNKRSQPKGDAGPEHRNGESTNPYRKPAGMQRWPSMETPPAPPSPAPSPSGGGGGWLSSLIGKVLAPDLSSPTSSVGSGAHRGDSNQEAEEASAGKDGPAPPSDRDLRQML